MKIYFNPIPTSDIEYMDNFHLFGPNNESDNFFYNYIEYGSNPGGTDEVTIADGCNRQIPLNMEAVPDLICALEKAYAMWLNIRTGETLVKIAQNSEVELYVEDNKITVNTKSVYNAIDDAE